MSAIPRAKAVSRTEIDPLGGEDVLRQRALSESEAPIHSPAPSHASLQDLIQAGVVLESIADALFGLDSEWRIAYLNEKAARLLGCEKKDLVGQVFWELDQSNFGTTFQSECERARTENADVEFEVYFETAHNWFEVRAYPLLDGVAVYFQNVNERRRTERDLRQREAELRTILDNVPVIISWVGPNGRFKKLNRRFSEVFGMDPEWAMGRTVFEVAGEPHATIARPFMERALRGEPVTFESMIRDRAGQLRDVKISYAPQRTVEGELDGLIVMVDDITEEKRSESALRESENRFRSVFDMAATGMALVSVSDGKFEQVNAKLAQILGYSADEMLALRFLDLVHPEDLADSEASFHALSFGPGTPYQIERRYVCKDGATVWGQTSVSLMSNENRLPPCAVVVVEDITDRKLNEAALRESENRLRFMAESLPQLVWTCLPNGNCDYLSAQWVEYTGVPEQEQLGLRWLDLVMHPEDRERTFQAWMAAVRDEAAYDLEYRLRRRDGEYRWFKTRGTPLRNSSGQIVRWFGTCTDIHDQRESAEERRLFLEREQQARALAENLNRVGPLLLTELDSQRLIQRVTDLATELVSAEFGSFFQNVVDENGELYLLHTVSGVPRDTSAGFPMPRQTAVFASTFNSDGVMLSQDVTTDPRFEWDAPHDGIPKGHLQVRSYLAVPVLSRSGKVLGGLFFGHSAPDRFTERHAAALQGLAAQAAIALDNARLFAEVQRSNLELQQANADLEQFAYAAAHDLQEPLRMVTSYTQLLDRSLADKLDDRTRTFMGYVVGGALRMSLLLQDLLAYTEASRASESDVQVSLKHVLGQVLRNLHAIIVDTGARITVGDLPAVRGRESHFVQLFQNLISNALKYRTGGTAPGIDISAERQSERWLIRTKDNGIGIDPAYHRQVFGVFKRLHGSEIPGTGIGLAICQRVVERAGGEIWVESTLGQGSTFCFTLPVRGPEKIVSGADRGT